MPQISNRCLFTNIMTKTKARKPKLAIATSIKSHPAKNKAREDRIIYEIVVDAYSREERALGWYYYLEGKLKFPFRAACIKERATSPLRLGEKVEVLKMAPEEDCEGDMLVIIRWADRTLGVPLSQLKGIAVDKTTKQAVDDWNYWLNQGYVF